MYIFDIFVNYNIQIYDTVKCYIIHYFHGLREKLIKLNNFYQSTDRFT